MKVKGNCILCEKQTELTKEHVPPRRLGNTGDKKTRTGNFEDFLKADFTKGDFPKGIKRKPQGNVHYTLCGECNSFFGSEYVKEYIKFAEDNRNFLYGNINAKKGTDSLTYSVKKINPIRVAKEVVAMFFSINGENDSMDKPFLDAVRGYLSDPKNNFFPHEDYQIIMNYYLPIGLSQDAKTKIPNDIIGDNIPHNVIKSFMTLDISGGKQIRFSEIQYDGIGFTLVDLKKSTFIIKEGYDLKTFLCADDKIKEMYLYKIPILTPMVITMMEMHNGINYPDPGSDLLVRWQLIVDFLTELKRFGAIKLNLFQNLKSNQRNHNRDG
ncbi:hypothetical protein [Enterococcus sp. BWR-S5]|uniref:hypothetical protein n=1 Tax=Enterococcus sp. BWR-S5 TaxID=2787714 RepID=UPI0019204083|nr:hypothetical protein [Enterococcus sp. BWR-S5]MBL1224215.1 hypothetical protein [Enterococcus sp. BWR-S5]